MGLQRWESQDIHQTLLGGSFNDLHIVTSKDKNKQSLPGTGIGTAIAWIEDRSAAPDHERTGQYDFCVCMFATNDELREISEDTRIVI